MRKVRVAKCSLLCGLILTLGSLSLGARAQTITPEQGERHEQEKITYFKLDSATINLSLMGNDRSFGEISELLDDAKRDSLITIKGITIESWASPEAGAAYNQKLSERRTDATAEFLIEEYDVDPDIITRIGSGVAWQQLRAMVEATDKMSESDKAGVIRIIDEVPVETWRRVNTGDRWLSLVDSRRKQLMDYKYGNPYRFMAEEFFPVLRFSSVVTVYFQREMPAIAEPEPEPEAPKVIIVEPEPEPEIEYITKPLFAIKTNLLFDAVTALNVEVEVPIGDRWSVAGEWIFPWWESNWGESSNRNCFQMLNGNIEGKYWFGDRTNRPVMTGWSLGLYAGGGYYDFEYHKEGYQGEFFLAAGLSAGYAHTINKKGNLRMEYNLGVGYLQTNYRYYEEYWGGGVDEAWQTIRQYNGKYSWLGPTRARISFVWLLNTTKQVKGGQQ